MNSLQEKPTSPAEIVFSISDLVSLIADYCDDEALLKLTRLNKHVRKIVIHDSKDRYIRTIEFKYSKVTLLLEDLIQKIQNGQLVDLEILRDSSDIQIDSMTLYRKHLLKKHPTQTLKNYMKLNKNLEKLKQKRQQIPYSLSQNALNIQNTSQNYVNPRAIHIRRNNIIEDYIYDEAPNMILNDSFYDALLQKRSEMMHQYDTDVQKHNELDRQCMDLMSKMSDRETSVSEIIDGFFNYKINRFRTKMDSTIKRIKGEVTCDSDIITEDLLQTQYFVNSISDKIIDKRKVFLEPFRQPYVLKEIKNAISERLNISQDQSKFTGVPLDMDMDSKTSHFNFYQGQQEQVEMNRKPSIQFDSSQKQMSTEQQCQCKVAQFLMKPLNPLFNTFRADPLYNWYLNRGKKSS